MTAVSGRPYLDTGQHSKRCPDEDVIEENRTSLLWSLRSRGDQDTHRGRVGR